MAKRRPSGDGMVRKREDGRWEGRIVVGHKKNGDPIHRYVLAKTQRELTEKGQYTLLWLVIMDVNMPIMMGSQALQIMRQHPVWRQVPVMMLSTSDDPDMIRNLKAMGANAFLTKPRTYAGLVEHIKTVFEPWMTKVQALEYH